jgi:hypothetical protein
MIRCSLNEVETLLTKAARGCGADASQAARFGQGAVMCLCAGGATDTIHAALAALPGGVVVEYAAKIQSGMMQPVGNIVVFLGDDPLWNGYMSALPYRMEWRSMTECAVYLGTFEKTPKPVRLEIASGDLARWQALAARTFVPESEQSRLGGAGAGLTDND